MGMGILVGAVFIIGALVVWYIFFKRKGPTHPTIRRLKKEISKLDPELAKIPIYVGDSAYTENKSTIYVCLKHPRTGQVYDMNTLLYVTLHEIAHVITSEYDEHGPEWQSNFSKLLNRAHRRGIYDPSQPVPKDYCGIDSKKS